MSSPTVRPLSVVVHVLSANKELRKKSPRKKTPGIRESDIFKSLGFLPKMLSGLVPVEDPAYQAFPA